MCAWSFNLHCTRAESAHSVSCVTVAVSESRLRRLSPPPPTWRSSPFSPTSLSIGRFVSRVNSVALYANAQLGPTTDCCRRAGSGRARPAPSADWRPIRGYSTRGRPLARPPLALVTGSSSPPGHWHRARVALEAVGRSSTWRPSEGQPTMGVGARGGDPDRLSGRYPGGRVARWGSKFWIGSRAEMPGWRGGERVVGRPVMAGRGSSPRPAWGLGLPGTSPNSCRAWPRLRCAAGTGPPSTGPLDRGGLPYDPDQVR
jgi:hypothetical protein